MSKCELCGEPMPAEEVMFKYHGYSGNCPKPPLQKDNGDQPDTNSTVESVENTLAKRDSSGMPTSSDERHLRRLLALHTAIPNIYIDDGEAQGQLLGITIDFMREPVKDIAAKLRALNVAQLECRRPPADATEEVKITETPAVSGLAEPTVMHSTKGPRTQTMGPWQSKKSRGNTIVLMYCCVGTPQKMVSTGADLMSIAVGDSKSLTRSY